MAEKHAVYVYEMYEFIKGAPNNILPFVTKVGAQWA